jgi:hypothetical protein
VWDSPLSLQQLDDFLREIINVSRHMLHRVLRNIFSRYEACLEAGGQYFEIIL